MKKLLTALAFAALLPITGCSLFGVSPEDSEEARVKVERVVTVAQFFVATAGIAIDKISEGCTEKPDSPLCGKPEVIAGLIMAHDALSARLVDLQVLVDAGSTDAEQLAGAIDLVFAAVQDVTNILNAINAAD
jgi:hypothetical protein